MTRKVLANSRGIVGLAQALLGLVLVIAFVLAINALFASRSSRPANQTDPKIVWVEYTDPVAGLSFKYPEEWQLADLEPGRSARLINSSSSYYRGIEFIIDKNPMRLPPRDFVTERLSDAYGAVLPSTLRIEAHETANISGIKVSGYPQGILTTVVVAYGETMVRISLIEGGEVGGAEASSFPTAQEDERVFFQILDTLVVSSPR